MTLTDENREVILANARVLKERLDAERAFEREDFTIDELALKSGIHRNSLYAAVKRGELGHYRVGRIIRVTQKHWDAFREGTTGCGE